MLILFHWRTNLNKLDKNINLIQTQQILTYSNKKYFIATDISMYNLGCVKIIIFKYIFAYFVLTIKEMQK